VTSDVCVCWQVNLICLCSLAFDTLALEDWRLFNLYSKNKRTLKEHQKIMGLLDSILSAVSGTQKSSGAGEANPLLGVLSGLLAQSGGLQGLADKFSQSGPGNAFSSWVGMGENQPISGDQIQEALGSERISALGAKIGVDPALASSFLAEYLPKIIDKLTPTGKVDPSADTQQGLAALLPSLLQSLGGKPGGDQSAQA
jgi:uncharacterized protein YidB (DUF937 family)